MKGLKDMEGTWEMKGEIGRIFGRGGVKRAHRVSGLHMVSVGCVEKKWFERKTLSSPMWCMHREGALYWYTRREKTVGMDETQGDDICFVAVEHPFQCHLFFIVLSRDNHSV